MFTGIVEEVGTVLDHKDQGTGRELVITAKMIPELKVDQSIAHNGVCLTVTCIDEGSYRVTAVKETLERSQLGELRKGDPVNLERCLRLGDRLDGHMVQGHVDTVTRCTGIRDENGSWWFSFLMPREQHLLVAKGSISINGVSLTVADLQDDHFSVAIIPYTFEHTTFRSMRVGHSVNLEFDVLGKYVERMLAARVIPG
jgi:riboflavin synthase